MNRKEIKRIRREIYGKPKGIAQKQSNIVNETNPEVNPELAKLFPPEKIERIKAKALRRYKRRQDIQWENYLESVSK